MEADNFLMCLLIALALSILVLLSANVNTYWGGFFTVMGCIGFVLVLFAFVKPYLTKI